jgi:hypothetical protein
MILVQMAADCELCLPGGSSLFLVQFLGGAITWLLKEKKWAERISICYSWTCGDKSCDFRASNRIRRKINCTKVGFVRYTLDGGKCRVKAM